MSKKVQKELTLDKVMSKIHKRLNRDIQINKTSNKIPMKFSSAMITREEFEVLEREVTGLIFFQESRLNQDRLLEENYDWEVK